MFNQGKKLTSKIIFRGLYEKILPFFYLIKYLLYMKKIKNIKISEESHLLLKTYCENKGLKIYKFLESLIKKTCEKPKDVYGE